MATHIFSHERDERHLHHHGMIHSWWMNLLLGIVLVAFGAWMFLTPFRTYIALAIVFSFAMLASGITEVVFSIANRQYYKRWGWSLAGGIIDLILGLILVAYPVLPIVLLPVFVSAWLIVRGVAAIITAVTLRSYHENAWSALLLLGIAVILFSLFVLANPAFGAYTVAMLTTAAFVVTGIYNIVLGLRLRKFHLLS